MTTLYQLCGSRVRRLRRPPTDDENGGAVLHNVHRAWKCAGRPCVIHNPTRHHMSTWRLHWRYDRKIFERICEHGIGHPDPDQFDYWRSVGRAWERVHGCDGCCISRGETG